MLMNVVLEFTIVMRMRFAQTLMDHFRKIWIFFRSQEIINQIFRCKCKKGFLGDGKQKCDRTCIETCHHGRCTNYPDYKCVCDLGWSGSDCSINCGCHNHSTCKSEIGLCDECQDYTEGLKCEKCVVGSYGNATTITGCIPCDCNRHGDQKKGQCHPITGQVGINILRNNKFIHVKYFNEYFLTFLVYLSWQHWRFKLWNLHKRLLWWSTKWWNLFSPMSFTICSTNSSVARNWILSNIWWNKWMFMDVKTQRFY